MEMAAQLLVLAGTTVIAAGAAFGMAWVLLRGAFHLMQPATARSLRPAGSGLAAGTRSVARGFVKR